MSGSDLDRVVEQYHRALDAFVESRGTSGRNSHTLSKLNEPGPRLADPMKYPRFLFA